MLASALADGCWVALPQKKAAGEDAATEGVGAADSDSVGEACCRGEPLKPDVASRGGANEVTTASANAAPNCGDDGANSLDVAASVRFTLLAATEEPSATPALTP